ncbi:aspartate/glutamate racemase family protein [Flexilinea flocculi]|jgi:allantoin racemase|uniref:Asp/Glu/hydantoin racemase n=1 Tax=Flexilinea flocculi TaxID=1678840 RepID=A0A0S7BSL8_9CHLR|nr:aspartate/glutamate racemase family protein [Flexilinea flocculi]GAP41499.1 Asp/Glu/hydantoin racemase [Flexilinea flocculi]
MKILVLNPNTSEIVTQKVADVIHQIARPDTEVVVKSIEHGPESLESFYDEALAVPYEIDAVKKASEEGFAAIIIAAFCDPGIEALKEISSIPVFGLEECSFSVSLLFGNKFGILTEKKHKESVKSREVRKHGLEKRFAGVCALDMGVVEIANQREKVFERGKEAAKKLIENGAEVIILGCSSMAGYSQMLSKEIGIPVIDPTIATFKLVEGLIETGLSQSKIGLYSTPKPQKFN